MASFKHDRAASIAGGGPAPERSLRRLSISEPAPSGLSPAHYLPATLSRLPMHHDVHEEVQAGLSLACGDADGKADSGTSGSSVSVAATHHQKAVERAVLGSAPLLASDSSAKQFCYRHQPSSKGLRKNDEPSMNELQKQLATFSKADQDAIAQVWSLFSHAPSKQRTLMLGGIVSECCFPQLSYLATCAGNLIKIDFISALPCELAFKILGCLDSTSLCKAAQVSRKWRSLADDDFVWRRMCQQHTDRQCTTCGWGLPRLELQRLQAEREQARLQAANDPLLTSPEPRFDIDTESDVDYIDSGGDEVDEDEEDDKDGGDGGDNVDGGDGGDSEDDASPESGAEDALKAQLVSNENTKKRASSEKPGPSPSPKRVCNNPVNDGVHSNFPEPPSRPWKQIYKDRFKVGTNWKHGRCYLTRFQGHEDGVMCVQFKDNILATGSYDQTIRIWDMKAGKRLRTLSGHEGGVRCLQFDRQRLLSGGLDCTLRVWNWHTGELLRTFAHLQAGVITLHFAKDILACGSMDNRIRVWDAPRLATFTLESHTDYVNSVQLDPVSRTLFSASDDTTIKLWDLDSHCVLRTFEGHLSTVQQVVLMPDGFELQPGDIDHDELTSDSDFFNPEHPRCHLHTRRRATDSPPPPPDPHPIPVQQLLPLKWPPAGSDPARPRPPPYFVTGSLDGTLRLWSTMTGRSVRTFFGHVEGVWAVAADALRIVSASEDGKIKIWDPRTGRCLRTFWAHEGPATCIALSEYCIVTGGEDREIRMLEFRSRPDVAETWDEGEY